MMRAFRDLGHYFTRPIIPFCFGIPLLLPAALLVAVAFLQDDHMMSMRVLGLVLLSLSALSISSGIALGVYDLRKERMRSKISGGGRRVMVRQATPREKMIRFNLPTTDSNTAASTLNASQASEKSDSAILVGFGVTNENTRLFPHISQKRRKSRRGTNAVFPTKKLPALKEEDYLSMRSAEHSIKSNDNRKDTSQAKRSEENLKKLEEYLKSLGLGGKGADLPKSPAIQAAVAGMTYKEQAEFLRSKSMPESAFQAMLAASAAKANGTSGNSVPPPVALPQR